MKCLVVCPYLLLLIIIVSVVSDVDGAKKSKKSKKITTTTTEADADEETTTIMTKKAKKSKKMTTIAADDEETTTILTTTEEDDSTLKAEQSDDKTTTTASSDDENDGKLKSSKQDSSGDTDGTTSKPPEEKIAKNETMEKMAQDIESGQMKFSMSSATATITKGIGKLKNIMTSGAGSVKNAAFYKNYNRFVQSMYSKIFQVAEYKDKTSGANGTSQKVEAQQRSNFWVTVPLLKNILGKTCFEDIGCFTAMEYQDFTRRPIPLLPMAPEFIYPIFHMFTLKNKINPQNFSYNATAKELKNSTFNADLRTILIVHGYRSTFEPWMIELKDFIFNQTSEYNVICVVWEKGAMVPLYHLAATNTRVVGALIAFFINTLTKTFKIKNDKFWLIGHSLGGQIVGYAGKRLTNPKVFRITGLDPAGPGFFFENTTMHIDKSDATFVDVWHTDSAESFSEGMGSHLKRGFIDFFPNGGLMQPGCKTSRGIGHIIHSLSTGEELSCSHTKATLLPYSIGNNYADCQAVAYECVNYETFIEGRCTECRDHRCQLLGLQFNYYNKPEGFQMDDKMLGYRYWIQTAPKPEYCVQHYQFALHVSEESDPATGILDFEMKAKFGSESDKTLQFEKYMTGTQIGETHSFLITFQHKLMDIKSLTLQWSPFSKPIDKWRTNYGKKMKVTHIEINFMSHLDRSVRDKLSYILCLKEGKPADLIVKTSKVEFVKCKGKVNIDHIAKEAPLDLLVPLASSSDTYYIDYEKLNTPVERLDKSNFANKSVIANYFG